MPKYMLTYHMDAKKQANMTPQNGKAGQEKFMQWAQGIANITIFPSTPCLNTKIVLDGSVVNASSENSMMGFSIIEAEDMETALSIALDCPHQEMMGPIQVAECAQMPT